MSHEIEKVAPAEAPFQQMDFFSEEFQGKLENQSQKSIGLLQIYDKDIVYGLTSDLVSQTSEYDSVKPSIWSKFLSWFKKSEKPSSTQTMPTTAAANETSPPLTPINSVPALDKPEHIPEDLIGADFPENAKKTPLKNTLTSKELGEAIALMSQQTIESVMFIVYKAQINLEKDNASTAEKTFSKYLEYQKNQQQVLQEIKEVLMKDEKVAKQLKTVQNITVAAAVISGIAAGAMSFGLLGPVGGFIGAALGQTAAGAFMAVAGALGTYGPAVTAGLTGVTMGSKAYFKRRANEDKAKHEEVSGLDKYYNNRLDDMRDRLSTISKLDSVFKEHWIRFLKRLDKMRKLALKK